MEPITRSEMLMDGQYVEPITRKEKILAGDDLEPVTREEYFLKKYRHSGGDVDVVQLTATENKTYTAPEGKAYSPVSVNVPEKKLTTLNANENKTYSPPSGYDGFSEVEVYVPYVTQGTTINENGTYTPPAGVDGFGRVIVDVPTPPPSLQSLIASHNGYFLPSSGYEGFSEVTVDVPLPNNAYLLESQKDDVVTIQHGAEFDMPKLIVSIEPQQSGSGDPSPENVRPISGWTACNVVRTGKNLFDASTLRQGDYNRTNENIRISENLNDRIRTIVNQTYTISFTPYGNCKNQWVILTNANNIIIEEIAIKVSSPVTFTAERTGDYICIVYGGNQTVGGDWEQLSMEDVIKSNPQIELGLTATSYEPYNGNTYTITFQDGSTPLTVYGGKLNVTTGVLTVDRVEVDLGDLAWAYESVNKQFYSNVISDAPSASGWTFTNIINSNYKIDYHAYGVIAEPHMRGFNGQRLYIVDDRYTDATQFKTYLSGALVVYKLDTPQTYQLTPTQIKSLLGVNNIYADTGEVDVQIWTKEV